MIFKRFRGQIFGVELSPKEQKALDEEIKRQEVEIHRQFTDDYDYMVMWILHRHFGFGLTRLKRFYDIFSDEYDAFEKHYEMADAGMYIARKEMNAIGCNVEQWNKERGE